jgi:DNA-binding HxlR family transcriptional regulator
MLRDGSGDSLLSARTGGARRSAYSRDKRALFSKGTSTKVMRFSDLERAIPSITQKMLGQQLKSMEADGIVHRTAYPQVPPKVEYRLTKWGQSLCPPLDAILKWAGHVVG